MILFERNFERVFTLVRKYSGKYDMCSNPNIPQPLISNGYQSQPIRGSAYHSY